jgi:hypothetical protein
MRAVRRKPKADKSGMYVVEESSSCIVPAKCPNKSVRPLAEDAEGRQLAKENTLQQPRTGLSARVDEYVCCGVCGHNACRLCARHESKVGTVCGSAASTGLCGGRRVTAVPTATGLLVN